MKSASVPETRLWIREKAVSGFDFIQDRRLCADMLFIRAQPVIRADGTPSAQVLAPQFDLCC
jgi:hypothetical protein